MNGRFSAKARTILVMAQNEADARRHNFIDTDHVLLAMLRKDISDGVGKVLSDSGVEYDRLSALVGQNPYQVSSKRLDLSRDTKHMLELAVEDMKRKGEVKIQPEHLLVGVLQIEASAGVELLFRTGCNISHLYAAMDVSLPKRAIRDHQEATAESANYSDGLYDNVGCLPGMVDRIKQLFTGG